MKQNKRMKKQNIIYGVMGILTLVITTIGATFAYFTATATNTATITGNMATITFNLQVTKMTTVDESKGGLIPMSNSMIQSAVDNSSTKGICVDDNGNAVCQIYKINVENTGSANMFLDGYVTLTGGSGEPTDYPTTYTATNKTTMRWAQAFCDEADGVVSNCNTIGRTTTTATKSNTGVAAGITSNWANAIEDTTTTSPTEAGKNRAQILTSMTATTTKAVISGNDYDVINTNYIRISDHTANATYTQSSDVTSALVYNEYLSAKDEVTNPTGGSGLNGTAVTYTDSQVYYIVVWLGETGTNQTAGSSETSVPSTTNNFYQGNVTFVSAQGSEVTAKFAGWTAVNPDTKPTT